MAYQKQTWRNLPDRTTPITAARLEHMETQYDEAISEVNPDQLWQELSGKADTSYVDEAIADVITASSPTVNPAQFGVPDNGLDDATEAFHQMISQLDDGVVIESTANQKFKLESTLILSKPLSLRGGEFLVESSTMGIQVAADDVSIEGVVIRGEGTSSTVIKDHILLGSSGTKATPIKRTRISNSTLLNAPYAHIWLEWVTDFWITDNYIQFGQYAGVMLISPKQGVVKGNTIRNFYQAGDLVNSYGIAATDWDNDAAARAEDVLIEGNFVSDIQNWEGIDTHGGKNISVIGNTVRNTRTPIAITTGNTGRRLAPEYCTVMGNYVERGNASTQTAGIVFNGKTGGSFPTRYAHGVIGQNVIKGFTKDLILDYYDQDRTTVAAQAHDGSEVRGPKQQPFRVWAANTTVTSAAGNVGGTRTVTFPSGYFTAPPIVMVTKAEGTGARHIPYTTSTTSSSVTVGIYDPTGGTGAVSVLVGVLAIQTGSQGNGETYP